MISPYLTQRLRSLDEVLRSLGERPAARGLEPAEDDARLRAAVSAAAASGTERTPRAPAKRGPPRLVLVAEPAR